MEIEKIPPRVEGPLFGDLPPTVAWVGGRDGWLALLDQTLLPTQVKIRECRAAEQARAAICELCVRGAPAIGVAGAYALCLALRSHTRADLEVFRREAANAAGRLKSARPTAVNLAWAIDRLMSLLESPPDPSAAWDRLLEEAHAIWREEVQASRSIGEYGAALIREGVGVLTHCNAGALATVAYGTALAPMYMARQRGVSFRVYADETRPLLQGARLTAFELQAAGIDVCVLCDGAAASLMARGAVDLVIVGADRIARNGDTANKIGTYGLAIAARHHKIPFYVAAPLSTFDFDIASGARIPIEQRADSEIARMGDVQLVAGGVRCENCAFDVTPADLISGFITDRGLTGAADLLSFSGRESSFRSRRQ